MDISNTHYVILEVATYYSNHKCFMLTHILSNMYMTTMSECLTYAADGRQHEHVCENFRDNGVNNDMRD